MVKTFFRPLAGGAPLNGAAETAAPAGLRGKLATIFRAATEVNRAIFFSAPIIIVGFIPLFTLSGVEGHIFSPMAKTYAYALAGALIATFTVVPAFSAYLLHTACARPRRSSSASCVGYTLLWSSSRLRTGFWHSLQPA